MNVITDAQNGQANGTVTRLSQSRVPLASEWKLWVYTNYDCNLRCSYCVAQSSPNTPRRAFGLNNVLRLVDEAVELGFDHIFFTGGEPFLLPDIYEMLAYASTRIKTTVLTNAMLLHGERLEKLSAVAHENLIVQVSLDGGQPQDHDAYRGEGSWAKTIEGIRNLQERGFRVRLGTTETPANTSHLAQLHRLRQTLGISEEDHIIRPLVKLGFAQEGLDLDMDSIVPEVTISRDGVFWHPFFTDSRRLVTPHIFPLQSAVKCIQQQMKQLAHSYKAPSMAFL
jgi:MoaA/NifB/PqqE/SkfB family radical SAM enzyme